MLTTKGQIAGYTPIDIARSEALLKGKPFCYQVLAMSAPQNIPDSMLITLTYIDSAAPADPHSDPKEFPMTVLLHFKRENDGKLNITQDDRCLGNPNHYATIASARKALASEQCKRVMSARPGQ